MTIKNIIFDLGGVLIDWNPKYLFTKVFESDTEMDFFLSEICSPDWNEMQDGGRTLAEGTEILISKHPDYEEQIRMFYDRWDEMLGGAIDENVQLLKDLQSDTNCNFYALTNWSAETWPLALREYSFLYDFKGVLVSGEERLKKPDPAIYQLLARRYNIRPRESLFIDDNLRNIEAAEKEGWQTVHYIDHEQLKKDIRPLLSLQRTNR